MLEAVARKFASDSREFWEATRQKPPLGGFFVICNQRLSLDSAVDSQVDSGVHPVATGSANSVAIPMT